jgi:hypothetical protein
MMAKDDRDLTRFKLPDDLGARLSRLGYRREDTSDVTWLEGYRLCTGERDGVYRFVAVDDEPRPHPLLVAGTYFQRDTDADESTNSQFERRALASVITDLQRIAWRRLHPSRWQQTFLRHRVAINVAVAVAVLSGIVVYVDSVSERIRIFGFLNTLSGWFGGSGDEHFGLLVVSAKILSVLVATTVGYAIANLVGGWRHPIMAVELSEKALQYHYGPEARRLIETLEREAEKPSVPPVAGAETPVSKEAEPVPWHGYDNFVSYEEFQRRLRLETKRSARFGQPVSCLIMTVEPASAEATAAPGDIEPRIQRECSQLIWREIREIDTSALYGDNGFIILMPNTSAEGARAAGTRLSTKVRSCDIGGRPVAETATIRTAVSCVVAGQGTEWEELVREAESSLDTGHDAP